MQKIDELIKNSMKAKDTAMMVAFRSVKAKMLIEKTKPQPKDKKIDLNEDEVFLAMVEKEIKERIESNELIKDNTKASFIENSKIIEGLQKFLPKKLSLSAQEDLIKQIIAKTQAVSIKDLGKVMSELTKHKAGLDMSFVSDKVKSLLSFKG